MVAVMTEALMLEGAERVLEIGTGSGYQAAILAELAAEVITIERRPELADEARTIARLARLLATSRSSSATARSGWPPGRRSIAILVTAGAPRVPEALTQQLSPDGGRLVIPVGSSEQQWLTVIIRDGDRLDETTRERVRLRPAGRRGCLAATRPPEHVANLT